MGHEGNVSTFSSLFVQPHRGPRSLTLTPTSEPHALHPSEPETRLSPEDLKFAAGMTQPLAEQPDPGVPQGVVGQIKLPQGLADPEGGRKILTSFGCEAAAIQPAGDKGWLKKPKELFWKVSCKGFGVMFWGDQLKRKQSRTQPVLVKANVVTENI